DVLELQIRKEDQSWLNDKTQAFPIAAALRDALAARLGIQAEELECSVEPRRREDGTLCSSIFIFDKNAAGYASSAGEHMMDILRDARERLLCKEYDCETACPHCILSFDLRYQSKELDRHKGLEVLTESWLSMLELPREARVFGPSTQTEPMRLEESVLSGVLMHPDAKIFLHLGQHALWQPGDPDMLHLLDILRLRKMTVEIALEQECYDSSSPEERMLLSPLAHGNVTCAVLNGGFNNPQARLAVSMEENGILYRWAIYEREGNSLLLKGSTKGDIGTLKPLSQKDLLPKTSNSAIVQIGQHENTSITQFGAWLWHKLQQYLEKNLGFNFIASQQPITRIVFSDRYCNSPLTVALFYSMMLHLQQSYGNAWNAPTFYIMLSDRIYRENSNVWDNWSLADERDNALREVLKNLGTIKLFPMKKNMLAHARYLNLEFQDGTILRIWLDQGLGFLRVSRSCTDSLFPFYESCKKQVDALQKMNHPLEVISGGTVICMLVEHHKR
ncbi:MAG: DUF1998 domain-containing protein, partial [Desulfovibrionaceae bacterium]|nr:DUF1998 domain-containing protein [Desulfovibrionaceae bacterium]